MHQQNQLADIYPRFDDALVKLGSNDIGISGHLPDHREGKSLLIASQGTQVGTQQFWHHVYSLCNIVTFHNKCLIKFCFYCHGQVITLSIR